VTGLATVATTGNYQDLSSKPAIPTQVGQLGAGTIGTGTVTVQGQMYATGQLLGVIPSASNVQGLSTVATSGQYTSLLNQPTIPAAVSQVGQLAGGAITSSTSVQGTFVATQTISSQTGDVIAYASDDRLKTKLGNIQGALEKVNSLNGFIYKFNDLANSFGFTNQGTFAGVSAQELEKVLPEVVKPAPFDSDLKSGNNYMTVQYEKVVPLLIESIKELARETKLISENLRIVSEHIGLGPKQA
jgi:hypothetical protein